MLLTQVIIARLEAVNVYFKAVEGLMFDLSIWRCSPELKVGARVWDGPV